MSCVHLRKLFQLCDEHELKLGSSDLIRVVCHQCNEQEVCPSTLTDEYDAIQARKANAAEAGANPGSDDGVTP